LIASLPAIGGDVKESSGHLGAAHTLGAHEVVEGILDLSMENVGQFIGEPAARDRLTKDSMVETTVL